MTGTWHKSLAAVVTVASAALFASACGSQHNAGDGSSLTIYSAQHEQTTKALVAAFTQRTGIKVNLQNDGEDTLTAKIEQEGAKSPADVFYTENSPWLEQLDKKGLLAKADAATLKQVPAADSAATGDWVGVSARISGITYNTSQLQASQLPKSIMDLADPAWKNRIELAPSETDFWPLVSSVLRTYGHDKTLAWLNGLKDNAGSNDNVPSNENLASDISEGNTALGVLNHYYFYRLQAEVGASTVKSAFTYFAPRDPGYIEDISGAAVLKSSKNQAAAQKFLAFVTSPAGQTVLAQGDSFEYPLAPGVAANPALAPLNTLQPNAFSVADLGTGEDAKALLQEAQLI